MTLKLAILILERISLSEGGVMPRCLLKLDEHTRVDPEMVIGLQQDLKGRRPSPVSTRVYLKYGGSMLVRRPVSEIEALLFPSSEG